MAVKEDLSGTVRDYAARHYVTQAKRNGESRFTIRAGDVHKALGFHNRVPVVCNALRSGKFLKDHCLKIIEIKGPSSGLSTTVSFTYEFEPTGDDNTYEEAMKAFDAARGCAKEIFAEFGGGEAYLRWVREGWDKWPYNRFDKERQE